MLENGQQKKIDRATKSCFGPLRAQSGIFLYPDNTI